MIIDLPIRPGQSKAVARTPVTHGCMRFAKFPIRSEMYGSGDDPCRDGRAYNFTVSGKRRIQLDAYFEVYLIIQVQCDMALLRMA